MKNSNIHNSYSRINFMNSGEEGSGQSSSDKIKHNIQSVKIIQQSHGDLSNKNMMKPKDITDNISKDIDTFKSQIKSMNNKQEEERQHKLKNLRKQREQIAASLKDPDQKTDKNQREINKSIDDLRISKLQYISKRINNLEKQSRSFQEEIKSESNNGKQR